MGFLYMEVCDLYFFSPLLVELDSPMYFFQPNYVTINISVGK